MVMKRSSKSETTMMHFGVFRPVGHVVVALESDAVAREAARALKAHGFDDSDVQQISAADEFAAMNGALDHMTDFAGFGYEVTLMRRYRTLAGQGCGWLIVYAPEDDAAALVMDVARVFNARLAERYHRLLIEDLV